MFLESICIGLDDVTRTTLKKAWPSICENNPWQRSVVSDHILENVGELRHQHGHAVSSLTELLWHLYELHNTSGEDNKPPRTAVATVALLRGVRRSAEVSGVHAVVGAHPARAFAVSGLLLVERGFVRHREHRVAWV